jgi:hypothetical protein
LHLVADIARHALLLVVGIVVACKCAVFGAGLYLVLRTIRATALPVLVHGVGGVTWAGCGKYLKCRNCAWLAVSGR